MLSLKKTTLLATPLVLGLLALPATAQQQQRGPGGPGGPPNGRFDPAARRQQMMADLKEKLGVTDQEFAALQPKIEKVMQAQRDASVRPMGGPGRGPGGPGGPGGGGFGPGGPGGPGGPQGDRPTSETEQIAGDLQMTLDNTDSTNADIKAGVEALRAARAKAKAELTKSQDELKQLVTMRQEAVLVAMGLLD